MFKKIPVKTSVFFLLGFLFLQISFTYAQETSDNFQNGTKFYKEGKWREAAAEFRIAQEASKNVKDWSEALYWVIMSELSSSDYGSALRDMDELEKAGTARSVDISYHRGRAYFYLGYFEDALLQFKHYNDSAPSNEEMRKAAAYYWMGECLYSMGQFDKAQEFYSWVTAKYPTSSKVEASTYRLDLIKQKKIEAELLMLLKWSHEEALRTSEDYQQKIKVYESTLMAYQKRFAQLNQKNLIPGAEIIEPEETITVPQQLIPDVPAPDNNINPNGDSLERARQLRNEVQWGIKTLENINGGLY